MATAEGAAPDTSVRRSRWTWLAGMGGGLAWVVALIGVVTTYAGRNSIGMIDLQVYRVGGLAWLKGLPLYMTDFSSQLDGVRLQFTYPPIAAVLFGPFAVVPLWLAKAVVAVGSFTALSGTLLAVLAKVNRRNGFTLALAGFAGAAALRLEPVRSTLDFGQINILLMVLVAADCLVVRNRQLRGLLVGLAAAIKLTPAVFVLYFLVRRDWRAAATSVVSFVLFGMLGWVLAPGDSADYWFGALLDSGRVGGLAYATNQSIRGVLHRINPPVMVEYGLWALLSIIVVGLAVLAARRAVRAGQDAVALVAIAIAGLLISPVSWTHHWVWAAPALVVVGSAIYQAGAWRFVPLAALGLAVFTLRPFASLPAGHDREMRWNLWQHLLGDSYVLFGIVLLVVFAFFWPFQTQQRPVPVATREEDRDGLLSFSAPTW